MDSVRRRCPLRLGAPPDRRGRLCHDHGTHEFHVADGPSNIGQRIPEFYDQLGSARESIETLIVPATIVDRPGAPELTVARGSIRFERVAFAYDAPSRDRARHACHVVKAFEL